MSILTNANAKLQDSLAPLYERVEAILQGMAPRDRKLLLGLLLVVVVVLYGGSFWVMSGFLEDLDDDVNTRQSTLAFLVTEGAGYDDTRAQAEQIEEQLREQAGKSLSSYLEKAAEKSDIKDQLDRVDEKSIVAIGDLETQRVEVSISKVTLEQLANFLYEVESGDFPLRIQSTNVRVKKSRDGRLLNVKFDIDAFRLLEEVIE
jgi:type II secretory pathway component PulM